MALKSSKLHRIAMKNWPLIGQWPSIGQFTLKHVTKSNVSGSNVLCSVQWRI